MVAIAATLVAALAGVGSRFFGSQPLLAADNPDVGKVCHAIKTLSSMYQPLADQLATHAPGRTQDAPPLLPWPPLPHEILGVDILGPPFSSRPPNNNHRAWEKLLQSATATALEPWLLRERGNKKLHDAINIASLCLRRPELVSVYREMALKLSERRWLWGRTITQDSNKRWRVLGEVCGWMEQQGGAGSDRWEL